MEQWPFSLCLLLVLIVFSAGELWTRADPRHTIETAQRVQRVLAFGFAHEAPAHLAQSAMVAFAAAALLAAWGLFVHLNGRAEELEPEARPEAKREDETVDEAERDDGPRA